MKYLLRIAVLSPLLLCGCVGTAPRAPIGVETKPEGPPVEAVQISSGGAKEVAASGKNFAVMFSVSNGKPAAIFSFKSTDINDRLGMALDIKNPDARRLESMAI